MVAQSGRALPGRKCSSEAKGATFSPCDSIELATISGRLILSGSSALDPASRRHWFRSAVRDRPLVRSLFYVVPERVRVDAVDEVERTLDRLPAAARSAQAGSRSRYCKRVATIMT